MITVKMQYVRSPAAGELGENTEVRAHRTFALDLLNRRSPVSQIMESAEILQWAKLQTGLDMARAKPRLGAKRYKPVLQHGSDHYIFWIWKGSAKNPTVGTQYPLRTDLIDSDVVSMRLELWYGKADRPRAAP